ncbi:MAG: type II toxin-antitoxin system VapC family toxin [Planctomycetes bacterium]|nr:type II toxin-antitoxin system VapC family toxin [Planctomycetota bacterium]
MNAAKEVCVDASLAVKVVTPEPDSDRADALFDEWASAGKQLIAPSLFEVEADSILRQKAVLRKELTAEQAQTAFAELRALPIKPMSLPGQRERAWELAAEFGLATVYDATYLALAELRGCEFWTADEALFNRVKHKLPFVKWLGGYVRKLARR